MYLVAAGRRTEVVPMHPIVLEALARERRQELLEAASAPPTRRSGRSVASELRERLGRLAFLEPLPPRRLCCPAS